MTATRPVTTESSWPAPAKLNLFLHVTGRRADGYHQLQTLFQLLDWGDDVTIRVTDSHAILRSNDIAGVTPEQDLSLRAAQRLQSLCRPGCGAEIAIRKRIPQGGGLGGASSDAATVLVALNRLWGCGLSTDELAALALELGADVPLFVRGRSAFAEGVGEQLAPVTLGATHYVLVMPGIHVSTAAVFADPDLERATPPIGRSQPRVFGASLYSSTRNDCEPVALRLHPALATVAEELADYGPVRMTGTGSAFFIPVARKSEAIRVTTALETRYNARAVRGVDQSALLDRLDQVAPGG